MYFDNSSNCRIALRIFFEKPSIAHLSSGATEALKFYARLPDELRHPPCAHITQRNRATLKRY